MEHQNDVSASEADEQVERLKTGLSLTKLRDEVVAEFAKGVDASQTRIDELQKQIAEQDEKLTAMAKGRAAGGPGLDIGLGTDVRELSLHKMIAGTALGWDNVKDSHREREAIHETMRKAQEAGQDTAGGFLVPSEFRDDLLIPLLEPSSTAIRMGANVLDGLVGSPVEIPAIRGDATAYWVAEDEEITTSQMTFGQVKFEPRGLASLVPMTNRLLRQTSQSAEGIVRDQLGRTLGKALDLAFYKGTGGKQPVGMANRTGIGSVDFSNVDPTASSAANAQDLAQALLDMEGTLEENDVPMIRPGYVMHPTAKRGLLQVVDADGRPILFAHSAGLVGQSPDRLHGHPYAVTTQLTAGSDADVFLIDFADTHIAMFETLQIDVSNVAKDAFEKRLTYVRATMECDINVGNAQSIVAANGFDVSGI